jgi:hypothetical protein
VAYTYAQLVRRECGDRGIFTVERFSGDGSTKDFFLRGSPILAASYAVKVGGTALTETSQYTLDAETGALSAVSAPAAGTDNVLVTYKVVELSDLDVTEALRQRGLDSTATADVGPVAALLTAAADLAEWRWSYWASAYDVTEDGETLSRSEAANAWRNRAENLRQRARSATGIITGTTIQIDGYNLDEVTARDVLTTARNPRRRYYGQDDRYP